MTTWRLQAQRAVAVVAGVFGLATIAAGTRVLLGGDPGYDAFRPLLVFNTLMGFAYCAAAVLAWKGAPAWSARRRPSQP